MSESCPICGGELAATLLTHNEPDRFERHVGIAADGYRRDWVGCGRCGSATNRHDPRNLHKLRVLTEAYSEVDFAGSSLREKYDMVMGLPELRSDNAGRVDRVLARLQQLAEIGANGSGEGASETLRVVDIGAGLGVFLAKLAQQARARDLALDLTAIEPDPQAVQHLNELGLFKVAEGIFSGQDVYRGTNLFTFNKVLEHIENPLDVLGDTARLVNAAQGLVYVEVPDVATIGNRPPNDNILGALHFNLYSAAGLALLFRRVDLHPVALETLHEPSGKITLFGFGAPRATVDAIAASPAAGTIVRQEKERAG